MNSETTRMVPDHTAANRTSEPRQASVVDLTFALWLSAIALLFNRALLNSDGDAARHIMIGRHIWSHGPRFEDPFSFTRAGEPFLAYEWMSQAAYAAAHAIAGLPAVAVLAAALIAGSLALVVSCVRAHGGDPWLAFMTGVAAALLSYPHWLARPHLFSWVGLAILAHLLGPRPRVVSLVLLFALWANLHPGFLYGLILTAVWMAGLALEDLRSGAGVRTALARSLPVAAAVIASLANPFGWSLHAHALSWLGSETVKLTDEFMPLVVMTAPGLIFLFVSGLLVAGLAAQRRWVGWPVVLLFWAAFVAALMAKRNGPAFAMIALPLVARSLTPLVRRLRFPALQRMRTAFASSDRRGWRAGAVAGGVLIVMLALDPRVGRWELLPSRFSRQVFPEAAIQTARAQGLVGNLLSRYEWGGYVLYTWPGQRVYIDSMADFFGDELIRQYSIMVRAADGWQPLLERYEIDLVLLPPDLRLVAALRAAQDWRVIHADDVAVLLARGITPSER